MSSGQHARALQLALCACKRLPQLQPWPPPTLARRAAPCLPGAGTLLLYTPFQGASARGAVPGAEQFAAVKAGDLFVSLVNVEELAPYPEGWGWEAEVVVTGCT